MRWSDIPFRPPTPTLRRFGIVGSVILTGLAAWQGGRDRWVVAAALFAAAAAMLGLALIRPAALRPIFAGLMVVTFPVNWLVSHLALAVIFYGVFTPLALLFRLGGRDVLGCRADARRDSYWQPKPQPEGVRSYFRQS
jgi:hypothetical protein